LVDQARDDLRAIGARLAVVDLAIVAVDDADHDRGARSDGES